MAVYCGCKIVFAVVVGVLKLPQPSFFLSLRFLLKSVAHSVFCQVPASSRQLRQRQWSEVGERIAALTGKGP